MLRTRLSRIRATGQVVAVDYSATWTAIDDKALARHVPGRVGTLAAKPGRDVTGSLPRTAASVDNQEKRPAALRTSRARLEVNRAR